MNQGTTARKFSPGEVRYADREPSGDLKNAIRKAIEEHCNGHWGNIPAPVKSRNHRAFLNDGAPIVSIHMSSGGLYIGCHTSGNPPHVTNKYETCLDRLLNPEE